MLSMTLVQEQVVVHYFGTTYWVIKHTFNWILLQYFVQRSAFHRCALGVLPNCIIIQFHNYDCGEPPGKGFLIFDIGTLRFIRWLFMAWSYNKYDI